MASPILLILGAGSNIGTKVAQKFAKNGFKVALAARSHNAQEGNTKDLLIKADFADPSSIKSIFDEVKSKLGVPNVVVYNAAAAAFSPDPFVSSVSEFASHLTVNTVSVYAAAKEAVAGFQTLESDAIKTFIYTGNLTNVRPIPGLLDLSVGKSATAALINALSQVYTDKGYRFYFGDERKADGSPPGNAVSGDNHADYYLELALKKEQGPWDATFVGGKGYVNFAK